jgi:two-component system response regulator DegU
VAKTEVLIADDHALFRECLSAMLEDIEDIAVVGTVSTGDEVIEQARLLQPDVILMDIRMPFVDGIEATRKITSERLDTRIIMLTMCDDDKSLFDAIKSGANGYFLKSDSACSLVRNIRAVAKGEVLLPPTIAPRLLNEFARVATDHEKLERQSSMLTAREKDVLDLMAAGFGNKQIARKLFISEKTVRNHISNLYRKLSCNSRSQAVLTAVREGMICIDKD